MIFEGTFLLQDIGLDDTFIEMIKAEDIRQLKKWGRQTHAVWQWLGFGTEETGETAAAIGEYSFRDGSGDDVITEAIQAATIFIKIAVMMKRRMGQKRRYELQKKI